MGDVPVIVRVVWSDGDEEWRPARAVRWTRTHVMVGWRTDDVAARTRAGGPSSRPAPPAEDATLSAAGTRTEQWVWLRAGDVMRSVTWLVPPDRGWHAGRDRQGGQGGPGRPAGGQRSGAR